MLIDNKKWIAFFSHTGNEIYNISKELGRYPDRVITNKSPDDSTINKKLAGLLYGPTTKEILKLL